MTRPKRRDSSLEDFRGDEMGAWAPRPGQARAAALTICDRARDAADARHLLEACGLAGYERGQFRTYAFGRVQP